MNETGDYEVRSHLHEAKLKEIASILASILPASMGFTLFIYDYTITVKGEDDHGSMFYMSSGNREQTINLLEEFIRKQKTP